MVESTPMAVPSMIIGNSQTTITYLDGSKQEASILFPRDSMKYFSGLVCVALLTLSINEGLPLAGNVDTAEPLSSEEEVKRLVVMVEGKFGADKNIGAGILFGASNDHLYIATANHIVRRGGQKLQELQVKLIWLEKPIKADLMQEVDESLDLAVLRIAGLKKLGTNVILPFDRWQDPSELKRGQEVLSLGNPQGRSWHLSVKPDTFSERNGHRLYYESNTISPGHSGGALLADWKIAGMILNDVPPNGEAVTITMILETLRKFKYPVQLGAPRTPASFASISAFNSIIAEDLKFTCGLGANGNTYCWGEGTTRPERLPGALTFTSFSSSGSHGCGITASGAAYCLGKNRAGQLGNRSTTDSYEFVRVQGNLTFNSLTTGVDHTCGLTPEGHGYCWGRGDFLGNGSKTTSVTPSRIFGELRFASLDGRGRHTCGIAKNHSAYCWGDNFSGQLGSGKPHEDSLIPVAVKGGLSFRSVSTGQATTCGLTITHEVYCWGDGYGSEPTRVDVTPVFESLVAGGHWHYPFVCGITRDHEAYCWGDGRYGQLGNGSREGSRLPVQVQGGLTFRSLSGGESSTCGIATNGKAFCWGNNHNGELGDGSTTNSLVPSPVWDQP
jgi:hypothetical protein